MPLGTLVGVAFLLLARPTWVSLLASLFLVVPGLCLRGYAAGYLKKKAELATTGPYAYTRNPLYLGSLLIAAGVAVASAQWTIGLAFAVLFVVVYGPTIVGEERLLRRRFPLFEEYARAVPRLLPRLTPANVGEAGGGGFSRPLYLHNREYQALLGAAAMYAFLAVRILFRG